MRAVYTETGARIQAEALKLGPVTYLTTDEAANASAAKAASSNRMP